MSDTFVLVCKILWKLPFSIFIAYLILNVWSLFIVYYNISAVAFTVEQIVMQNNGIPEGYRANISKLLATVADNTNTTGLVMNLYEVNSGTASNIAFDSFTTVPVIAAGDSVSTHKDFGDTILVQFSLLYSWKTPIKVGTADESNGETLVHTGGAEQFRADIGESVTVESPTTGLVYTNGDTKRLSLKLAYAVPCLRYYPE